MSSGDDTTNLPDDDDAGSISALDRLDEGIDRWWDSLRGRHLADRIFYTASAAADFSLVWHTFGVIEAIIEDDPMIAVRLSAVLGVESALINGPVKSLFLRRRPAQETARPHHLRQPRSSSFPSGHASAAVVAASILSRHGNTAAFCTLAAIVATSRIHVRIHHASDVAGGVAAGAVLAMVARRLLAR